MRVLVWADDSIQYSAGAPDQYVAAKRFQHDGRAISVSQLRLNRAVAAATSRSGSHGQGDVRIHFAAERGNRERSIRSILHIQLDVSGMRSELIASVIREGTLELHVAANRLPRNEPSANTLETHVTANGCRRHVALDVGEHHVAVHGVGGHSSRSAREYHVA